MSLDIGKYCLDLEKVSSIKYKEKREIIYEYYREMLNSFNDKRESMGKSYMNSLLNSGYLINFDEAQRDNKIDKILDGD